MIAKKLKCEFKIDLLEFVYQGSSYNAYKNTKIIDNELGYPSTISKNSKNIERTLLSCVKIKTRFLSKNVKIDPQEYVYQGSPYNASKNPKNHR